MGQPLTFCSYFNSKQCQSCAWIDTAYSEQLLKKEQNLRNAFSLAPDFPLLPTVGSQEQGFRNRAKMVVTGTILSPIIGLLGETKLDEGRELLSCPIHHPKLNAVIEALPTFIRDFNLIPYEIESRKGELKGLILFYSPGTDQLYLRFVLRSKECVSRIQKLLPVLQARFPSLACVSANIQSIPHAILEGPEEIFITRTHTIDHQLGEFVLKLAPQAFVQTNVEVATKLYETAADWIAEIKPTMMLDLFCGQGAFSFFSAKSATKILGIEINEDAVNTANLTAKKLNLTHLSFQCMDAQKETPNWNADLILVNPPRRGLGQTVKLIEHQLPKHLLYSSCSVETLAKDLKILESRYSIKKIRVFDLFPHTEHFETLVLLKTR